MIISTPFVMDTFICHIPNMLVTLLVVNDEKSLGFDTLVCVAKLICVGMKAGESAVYT